MSINLEKGSKINLRKIDKTLKNLNLCLGWDTRMDLDAFAILLDENDKIIKTVCYANKSFNGVSLSGDNLTGEGDGDDEIIYIKLNELPKSVKKISLFANIFMAMFTTFQDVNGAFVRLVNGENNKELARYDLNDKERKYSAFHFANVLVKDNELEFEIVGRGLNGSISKVEKYIRNGSIPYKS